ncbi:unnamed protein product, partial [Hapterophycus canaliculatus]
HAPCVRLFHSGGDVGCRTRTREGVTGPLLLVDSERALQDIEQPTLRGLSFLCSDASERQEFTLLPNSSPAEEALEGIGGDGLIAVLPEAFLNASVLHRLSATGRLGGVMVLQEGTPVAAAAAAATSLEDGDFDRGDGEPSGNLSVTTPQGDSTPTAVFDVDASYPWNPHGDGLLMESLDFPVVLVTAAAAGDSAAEVRARAVSNGILGGSSWRYPLHMGKMSFYFGGSAVDLNSQ